MTWATDGLRPGGPAEAYRDPARRASLMALFDACFPGLPAGISRAEGSGWPWDAVTEPFVADEGGRAVGHVGVLAHRVRVAGEDRVFAGIHAVAVAPDRRRAGVARGLLADALGWADERFSASKLSTAVPEVYAPHGFRALDVHVFPVERAGGEGGARPLGPGDSAWFRTLLAGRAPVSDRFASLDPGWLVGVDLALQGRSEADLFAIDALGAVVDWALDGRDLHVHDVFASALPPLDALARYAPPHDRVILHVCPDVLAPGARAVPAPEAGVLMVRGDWPLDGVPIGISRLAEH